MTRCGIGRGSAPAPEGGKGEDHQRLRKEQVANLQGRGGN